MPQSFIQVTPDSTGKQVDTFTVPSGHHREIDCIGSPTVDANVLEPLVTDLPASGYLALPVREVTAGTNPFHVLLAASNNASTVKVTAGKLFAVRVKNNTTTIFYVKIYDKSSPPAPATDAGILKQVYGCQAGVIRDVVSRGMTFGTGIALAVVLGISNTDNSPLTGTNPGTIEIEYL